MSAHNEHYHNKGQEDAGDGKYELPHGVLDSLVTWDSATMERHIEENDAYRRGHANTEGQADGAENHYDPPSNPDAREAYDEAWRASHDETHKSGCFLTTACVAFAGLPDTCAELQTLRAFRDGYVRQLPDGDALISEYYRVAPSIVRQILGSADRDACLREILTAVQRAVALIARGDMPGAFDVYVSLVKGLRLRVPI